MTRKLVELVAIVACCLALRELFGEAALQLAIATEGAGYGLPFYAMWGVVLLLAMRRWPVRFVPERSVWTWTAWLVLVLVLVATEWIYGWKLVRAAGGQMSFHPPFDWLFFANAAIAAPLVEEAIFRGVLWDAIRERSNALTAFVLTSVLFGTWHWSSIFHPSWYGASGVLLYLHVAFGAAMGALRWRLGAIGAGVALHAIYNGIYTITG